MSLAILAAIALILFFAAFFSKRRFGLLGLALTAGATLSTIWSYDAGLVISSTGFIPNGPMTNAVALSAVVLLPAILLLFHGYTYKSMVGRIYGSLTFAILAVTFLLEPLSFALPLTGQVADFYTLARSYAGVIISVGVVLAIVDIFFTKPVKNERERRR